MSPRIIAANLTVRIRSFYREKSAMFFTIAFPIILILVFGTIFLKQDNVSFDLYVQDLDQSNTSAHLINTLKLNGRFKINKVDPAINATEYARHHKLNLVLIIPKDYEKSFDQHIGDDNPNASVTLTYVYDPSSTSVSTKMQILNSVFAVINQDLSGKPAFITTVQTSILDRKYRFIEFFVPGIIAMAVMTASMSGALNINAELRQKGIIRKLCATPITRTDWILSNVLYQLILAVISTTTILVVSYAVFDVSLRINGWLPVFVVLEVFTFVGIGMVLARVVKEAESAAAAANVIMFPMMFLSGTFFSIEMMPGFLQPFARLLPLYYVNEGLRASMVFVDYRAALGYAAIIVVIAAVVFVLGIIATKWEESR
jgi:ABC-2 type transport system permease protein